MAAHVPQRARLGRLTPRKPGWGRSPNGRFSVRDFGYRGVPAYARYVALYPPGERTSEPLDDRLRDDDALAEIELTSRLMIAASGATSPLTQSEIDGLLGVDPEA